MKSFKIIIAIFICCIVFSCSQQLYVPVVADAAQQQRLSDGRSLYVEHCSGCHNLYLPQQFSADDWKKTLAEMEVKAKVSVGEKSLIFEYLTSRPLKSRTN